MDVADPHSGGWVLLCTIQGRSSLCPGDEVERALWGWKVPSVPVTISRCLLPKVQALQVSCAGQAYKSAVPELAPHPTVLRLGTQWMACREFLS